jgi:maltose-binding protein MalE
VFVAVDTIVIKPFAAKETYRTSRYVYTEKYGNVMITLPDAAQKKYSVAFLEENKKPVFEIKEIKSSSLLVDKANFIHAGWFWYELFDDGKLKERSKLFIPKDF